MTTEDYVSFEIAKLLKEKGFNEYCRAYYKKYHIGLPEIYNSPQFIDNQSLFELGLGLSAPTLQMAMKWLREVHHYYIQVMLDSWACGRHTGYYAVIQKTDSDFEMLLSDALDEVFYQTYEEACESALKYCLENLISKK